MFQCRLNHWYFLTKVSETTGCVKLSECVQVDTAGSGQAQQLSHHPRYGLH